MQEKHGFDFTAAFEQDGALIYKPQFPKSRYTEIQETGAKYFVQYMNEKGNLESILEEYENEVNKK